MRKNLQLSRIDADMTQAEVAAKLGIGTRYYQNIEYGERKGDVDLWVKLSNLLGKSIEYLLEQADDTRPN